MANEDRSQVISYGATDSVEVVVDEPVEEPPLETTKKKKKKKTKKNKIDIGTSMQSERTFFKWVWLGFHIGAIGTFILTFFAKSGHPIAMVVMVSLTWTLALSFTVFGMINYYRRRQVLAEGRSDRFLWDNPYGPYLAVSAIVFELLMVISFAVYTTVS